MFAQRGVQRVDRRVAHAECLRITLLLHHAHHGHRRLHLRHSRLLQRVARPARMFEPDAWRGNVQPGHIRCSARKWRRSPAGRRIIGPMRLRLRLPICTLLVASTVAACGATPADDRLAAATMAALADAVQRTGVPAAQWSVRSAARVRWPDGSLGCAQPGVRYTMAPVDGFRIVIGAGDRELDYRAGRRGVPVLCVGGARGGGAPVR
jgi:hypothetical protein